MIVTKLMSLTKCIDASTRNAIEWEMGKKGEDSKGKRRIRKGARKGDGKEERCGDLCIRVRREVDAAIIIYRCKILSHRRRQ